jgi:hypothetical protein
MLSGTLRFWFSTPLSDAVMPKGLPVIPGVMHEALREALPWPWDDPRYGANALVPGRPPLEISFVEDDPEGLRFDFEPGPPGSSPARRLARAVELVRRWAGESFGPAVVREFERYLDALGAPVPGPGAKFGAFVGAACDGRGLSEAKIYFKMEDEIPAGFPVRLVIAAEAALAGVPGLAPHIASIACGRDRNIPRLYFLTREEMPLFGIRPALSAAGLEHRVPEVLSLAALLLGPDFMVPAGAAVLSFRAAAGVLDCKLEFLARALRLSRECLTRNIQTLLSERPGTRAALRRWTCALGEDGAMPELLNVVGFRVSVQGPSRFGLYASPSNWSVYGRSS